MKKLVIGILAHVDAGKTTLSEALLYCGGALRRLGRVDHQDAFLDTFALERERGITIFSKQALLELPELEIQLLDTPGHVDFSAEAERTVQVLDAAVLVIGGTDGVQGHTRTLWRLLERCGVPTLLFVNKMDLAGADRPALLAQLRRAFGDGCVDFSREEAAWQEDAAVCGEEAMEEYLASGRLEDGSVAALVGRRALFPVWFGSALKLTGVEAFLAGLGRFVPVPAYPAAFGARVYKIARDAQGTRLTYLKVTGGTLRVKSLLTNRGADTPEDRVWEEKADQLRIYSGARYRTAEEAPAGTVAAVAGLSRTRPGDGLGFESARPAPALEPVLAYRLELPEGCDPHTALAQLRELEDEDPQLHLTWNETLRQIHIQLMGEVQLEVLQRLIAERFGLAVTFAGGGIVYRETIADTVEGVGHFEPLRHYAEVHVLLEPGERGSGVQLAAACPPDQLDGHWQNLILSALEEKEHRGVLIGAPLTDVRITLVAGRAHEKHTEGGDFRQAACRAVRQGLMQARSVLLEPWYDFRLELPTACVGRALSDLQRMGGRTDPPRAAGEESVLTGAAPAAELQGYGAQAAVYTRGRGRLSCALAGYEPCHNAAEIIAREGYAPQRDVDNPADSVFCSHGAGYVVSWRDAAAQAHVDSGLRLGAETAAAPAPPGPAARSGGAFASDRELQAIFERTYGPVRPRQLLPSQQARRREEAAAAEAEKRSIRDQDLGPEYLLVDGYNIIYAWEELQAVARDNLDAARKNLLDILSNYQGFRRNIVIVVFDAYKVPGGTGEVTKYHNIDVVYTREAETADSYIEKATYAIGRDHRVRVATSDGAEQLIILCHGALRLPASALRDEVESVEGQIAAVLERNNRRSRSDAVRRALEQARSRSGGVGPEPEPPKPVPPKPET
jgi:small GTP-binding protein